MRSLTLLTALALACSSGDDDTIDAALSDASMLDASSPDVGSLDAGAPDVEPSDASGVDAPDVAPDVFDAGPTPLTCEGEGVWRGSDYWCEREPERTLEFGCVLIATIAGECRWSGTVDDINALRFVVQDVNDNTGVVEYFACTEEPPPDPVGVIYRRGCHVPLEHACRLADMGDERYQRGVDYEPLCAAARARGITFEYLASDGRLGCPASL